MTLSKINEIRTGVLSNHTRLEKTVIALLLIFYVTILWKTEIAKAVYYIIALIALYLLATKKLTLNLNRHEKIVLWLIAAYFSWIVVTYFINGMPEQGRGWILQRQLRLLLFIPVYLLLRTVTFSVTTWWTLIVVGAITAGITAVTDVSWETGRPSGRAHGGTSAVFFGEISLCYAIFLVAGIKTYFNDNKFKILIWILALCLALAGVILSGSRTAWIAIPAAIVILSIYLTRGMTGIYKVAIPALLLVITVSLAFIPNVQNKIKRTSNQLTEYSSSTDINDKVRKTAVGTRLEIWRVVMASIKANPVFGIGIGDFKPEIRRYISRGEVNSRVADQPHAHNQYLETALYSGIPGLVIFLVFLYSIGLLIYKTTDREDKTAISFGVFGALLVTAYILFGIPDVTLSRKVPIVFFCITLGIILSSIKKKNS